MSLKQIIAGANRGGQEGNFTEMNTPLVTLAAHHFCPWGQMEREHVKKAGQRPRAKRKQKHTKTTTTQNF